MSKRSGAKKRRARLSRTEPPPKPPPKFGSRVQAVSAAAPVAQARWTQLQIAALFEQTVRSLLQVPNNEPEDLRALREIDERLNEPLLARSTKWMDLGPRSGMSDAQRMLRWVNRSQPADAAAGGTQRRRAQRAAAGRRAGRADEAEDVARA